MGHEYEFAVEFESAQEPAICFVQMKAELSKNAQFGHLFRLRVYRSRLDEKHLVENHHTALGASHTELEELVSTFPERYPGEDFLFEGWYGVPRYYRVKGAPIEKVMGHGIITVIGKHFSSQPLFPHASEFITYSVGNVNQYDVGLRYKLALQNLELLIDELKFFAVIGAKTIRGFAIDRSEDPARYSVCYHRALQGFLDDLKSIEGQDRQDDLVDPNQVIEAALQCDDIELANTQAGLLIYSKLGSRGNLKQFYETLANIIRK